jgi:hypothetical protein
MIQSLKNNSPRAAQAILVLKVIILFDVLMIAFDVLDCEVMFRLAKNEPLSSLVVRRNELRQLLISIFYTIVSFCSGLAFLGWFHRAYSNISRIGIHKTKWNPAWAIISFIIPVVNLYRPYQIIREIRDKNRSSIVELGGNIPSEKAALLPWWWTLWLISILSSLIYLLLLLFPLTKEYRFGLSVLSVFSDFTDIPAAILAIAVINHIHNFEKKLYQLSGT